MATAEQMVANAKEVKIKKKKLLNVCEFHGRWSDLRPWLCGIYSFQLVQLFLFVSKKTVVHPDTRGTRQEGKKSTHRVSRAFAGQIILFKAETILAENGGSARYSFHELFYEWLSGPKCFWDFRETGAKHDSSL